MKKIGFFIDNMSHVGGTERVTSMIANGLSEKYEVYVISAKGTGECFYPLNKNINLISLHGEKYSSYLRRKIFLIKTLYAEVKKRKLNIVIAVDIAFYIYLFLVKLFTNTKVIAWEHFNYYAQKNRFAKLSRFLAVKTADQIVVLGKKDYESYKKHFFKARNICYIHNPIVFPEQKAKIENSSKIVLAIGRLEDQKGFDLLLQIWKLIEKNKEWTLKIVGEGSKKEKLEKYIKDNELAQVEILPFTENISEYYLNASIFVLSSRFEGFVMVLLEALSYGLPCVSFDCKEGPAEIIINGLNGFLIPNGDLKLFSEKLQNLMDDEVLRKKVASNSSIGLERFKVQPIVKQWEELFERL